MGGGGVWEFLMKWKNSINLRPLEGSSMTKTWFDVSQEWCKTATGRQTLISLVIGATTGPPIIGDEARWKFSKIRVLCMDKIPKNSPNMFGLQQACTQKVNFCLDSSGLKKIQICSDWPIRPQKMPILFGSASKIAILLPDDSQMANCGIYSNRKLNHCVHLISTTCCASAFLACRLL